MVDDTRWMRKASCQYTDPELFFPLNWDHASVNAAQKICAQCPVAEQCLIWAITNGLGHGIFGGLTPEGRNKYRRSHKIRVPRKHRIVASHGTEAAYRRHKRAGEEPCVQCIEGYRALQTMRRKRYQEKSTAQQERIPA